MPDEIAARLPNARRMLVRGTGPLTRLKANVLRLMCFVEHFRTVRHTQIFAQDHISCASRLIGRCKYTLIEDAPGIFGRVDSCGAFHFDEPRNAVSRAWSSIVHGSVFGHAAGRNSQCINRWVTQESDLATESLAGRHYEHINMHTLWDECPDDKRREILRIFCGRPDPQLEMAGTPETLILTQPLMEHHGLTEDEMRAVYAPSVEAYRDGGVVVKSHPNDSFDFARHFPSVQVLNTLLPMQFLCFLGLNFKRVVTVSSSSVSGFPSSVEVVRIDVSGNPKLSVLGRAQ